MMEEETQAARDLRWSTEHQQVLGTQMFGLEQRLVRKQLQRDECHPDSMELLTLVVIFVQFWLGYYYRAGIQVSVRVLGARFKFQKERGLGNSCVDKSVFWLAIFRVAC